MKSNIFQLRERVTFLEPLNRNDGMGGISVSWARKNTVWAHVDVKLSFYAKKDKKGWNKPLFRIQIRSGIEVTPNMRLQWKGKLLKISTEPILSLRKDMIEFTAYEIQRGSSDHE